MAQKCTKKTREDGEDFELLAMDSVADVACVEGGENKTGESQEGSLRTFMASLIGEEWAERIPWARVGRFLGISYVSLHLLVAVAMDLKRAAPAISLALFAAVWCAAGLPSVRRQLRMWFLIADSALRRAVPYSLGVMAVFQLLLVTVAALILVITLAQHIERVVAIAGMFACMGSALLVCPPARRPHIKWRQTVAPGMAIQVIIAYIVLSTKWGAGMFMAIGSGAEAFLAFSYEGSDFVFTAELSSSVFIAFRMLPTIVFFSTISALLFYLGLVQVVVLLLGSAMQQLMSTSRMESVCAACNIFLGQSEACAQPLFATSFTYLFYY
jgi:hypothetical protein